MTHGGKVGRRSKIRALFLWCEDAGRQETLELDVSIVQHSLVLSVVLHTSAHARHGADCRFHVGSGMRVYVMQSFACGPVSGYMDVWMDGWMDGCICFASKFVGMSVSVPVTYRCLCVSFLAFVCVCAYKHPRVYVYIHIHIITLTYDTYVVL